MNEVGWVSDGGPEPEDSDRVMISFRVIDAQTLIMDIPVGHGRVTGSDSSWDIVPSTFGGIRKLKHFVSEAVPPTKR